MPPKEATRVSDPPNFPGFPLPQELVDECLSYPEPADLRVCALVCRSWLGASQCSLFQVVCIPRCKDATRLYNQLEETLRTSPHLLRHIHKLVLYRGHIGRDADLETQAFVKVCNLRFTHLAAVVLYDSYALPGAAVALQRLLSLPTIRRVHLLTRAAFLPIWDHLTPNVLHLRLDCMTDAPKPLQITQPRSPAIIAPKSLSLGFMYNIRDWLEHDLCPLDFSRLTVLSVETDTSVFCWPRMLPAHQTIQALEFTSLSSNSRAGTPNIWEAEGLSLFPNLLFLSMRVYFASKTIATLSTITPASRIQQIGFVVKHPSSDTCAQLDSSVADLPLEHPPSLGLEMDVETYGVWAPYFPRLKSQNRLRRNDPDWFEASWESQDHFCPF